jgi:arylsulfatase A
METDEVVGDVLQAIQKNGLTENTLVIFTSDNGHAKHSGLEILLKHGHFPSGRFRGYKTDIWDGGHRIPFIARWPGKVKAGSTCADTICLTDLMATCAEMFSVQLPGNAAEDSVSILPDLLGRATKPVREAVVHENPAGVLAIRQGKWKLILGRPLELYDMTQDEGERKNLAAQHPDIATRLTGLLQQYIANGRSTCGPKQKNDIPVDIFKNRNREAEEQRNR